MITGDTPTSSRLLRLAVGLWLAFGFVVWNVVFDHELVVAGRNYSQAASIAFREHRAYERLNDWMPAATSRSVAVATAAGLATTALGLSAVAVAAARARKRAR